MAHKKYYGYKPKLEHYSVVLHEEEGEVGDLLDFVYEDGRCGMNHYYWGSEIDYEYNRHGEVEHNYRVVLTSILGSGVKRRVSNTNSEHGSETTRDVV